MNETGLAQKPDVDRVVDQMRTMNRLLSQIQELLEWRVCDDPKPPAAQLDTETSR